MAHVNSNKSKNLIYAITFLVAIFSFFAQGCSKKANVTETTDSDSISNSVNVCTKYNITFDGNGGVLQSGIESQNACAKDLQVPTYSRVGYTFTGWDTEITQINSDVLIKAQWTAITYQYNLDVNGGNELATNRYNVNYGENFEFPTPIREGYTFTGWYNGSNRVESGIWNYTSNLTLIAHWSNKQYHYALNVNGGTQLATSQFDINYDETYELPVPTRVGYEFIFWNTEIDGSGTSYMSGQEYRYSHLDNITLYAIWSPLTYTITYVLDGEEMSSSLVRSIELPEIHTYNQITIIPDITIGLSTNYEPYATIYAFTGWYTNSNCVDGAINGQLSSDGYSSNITLYGRREPLIFNITYKDCGKDAFYGTHQLNYPTTFSVGNPATLDVPSKNGYKFMGWYMDPLGETQVFSLIDVHTAYFDITLYARWETYIEYSIIDSIDDETFSAVITGLNENWYSNENDSLLIPMEIEDEVEPKLIKHIRFTEVGNNAFYNRDGLSTIDLSNTVITKIGSRAFFDSDNLHTIIFPTTLVEIKSEAFSYCENLQDIQLPQSLQIIGQHAFSHIVNNNQKRLVIPNLVTSLGKQAFLEFGTDAQIPLYDEVEDREYVGRKLILSSSLTMLESQAFRYAQIGEINFNNAQITKIKNETFKGNLLTTVNLPSSLISIYDHAFEDNNLSNIIIPNYAEVGLGAFNGNEGIYNVYEHGYYIGVGNNDYYYLVDFDRNELNIVNGEGTIKIHKNIVKIANEMWNDFWSGSYGHVYTDIVIEQDFGTYTINYSTIRNSSSSNAVLCVEDIAANNNDIAAVTSVVIPDYAEDYQLGIMSEFTSLVRFETKLTFAALGGFFTTNSGNQLQKNAYIPASLKIVILTSNTITNDALWGASNVENVVITSGTNMVGTTAFDSCTSLEKVFISKNANLILQDNNHQTFYRCSTNLVIYTDYESDSEIPVAWINKWNNVSADGSLSGLVEVVYNYSLSDYLSNQL